jgi:predicted phage terminase large subunit-like protein
MEPIQENDIPITANIMSDEDVAAMSVELLAQMRELGKKDLFYLAHDILGYDLLVERIHDPICNFVTDTDTLLEILLYPRGSFKSSLVCIALPIFILLNDPDTTILLGCADLDSANKWIYYIKQHYERNPLFRALYPNHVNKGPGTWLEDRIVVATRKDFTKQAPSIMSASIEQIRTGYHYIHIILDDISTEINSQSDLGRNSGVKFIKLCMSLAERKKRSKIILSGTRYHDEDANGYFVGKGQAEMIEFLKKSGVVGNASSFVVMQKAVYDPTEYSQGIRHNLFPEIYTDEELLEIEFIQGPLIFNSQYQLDPVTGDRQYWKKEWFVDNIYKKSDIEDSFGVQKPMFIVTLNDPGAGFTTQASDTAFVTLGIPDDQKIYLLDARKGQWDTDEVLQQIVNIWMSFRPNIFGMEQIGFQKWIKRALDEYTQRMGIGLIPITELKANKGQETAEYTVLSTVSYFSQGRVRIMLPEHEDFMKQFLRWPSTGKRDYVRAWSYINDVIPNDRALSRMRQGSTQPRIFSYYEPEEDSITGR